MHFSSGSNGKQAAIG